MQNLPDHLGDLATELRTRIGCSVKISLEVWSHALRDPAYYSPRITYHLTWFDFDHTCQTKRFDTLIELEVFADNL